MDGYLIPIRNPKEIGYHEDPMFNEFTYGDVNERGRCLYEFIDKGDYLFFHDRYKGGRAIVAYYYVELSIPTRDAQEDIKIMSKYKNPHLFYEELCDNDTIIFGNPIFSKILTHPMIIDEEIRTNLIKKPKSVNRPWVWLYQKDIKFLLKSIEKHENEPYLKETYLSSEEVDQLLEEDIETFIEKNPKVLGKGLKLYQRQYVIEEGGRIDLLLEEDDGMVVVEIKKGQVGRETYNQIKGYIRDIEEEFDEEIRGIIVCQDVYPAFRKNYKKWIDDGKIEVFQYAWKFNINPINLED